MTDSAPMDCRELESGLADYLGGELPGPSRRRFELHLADCAACRARAQELTAAGDLIRAASGDDAWAARAVSGATVPARAPTAYPVLRGLAAAAVVALVFAIGFAAGRQTGAAPLPTPSVNPAAQDRRPDFAQRYARAARDFPGAGSMGWALTGLARRH